MTIALAIFFLIYYTRYIGNLCANFSTIGFDSQNFVTWYYTASNNILPYKDVFYLYGLVSYLKPSHIIFTFIYFYQVAITLVGLWIVLRILFTSVYIRLLAFFTLYIFNEKFGSFNSIWRFYAIPVVIGICLLIFERYKEKHIFKAALLSGILAGLLLSSVTDAGIYVIVLLGILALYYFADIIKIILGYLLGFLIGFLPHLIYLLQYAMLPDYINSLKDLSDMTIYAKVPFMTEFFAPNHWFLFLAMASTSFYLAYALFFNRDYFLSTRGKLQFLWFIGILFLENKNIVRAQIHSQFLFYGFMLFLIHVANILDIYKKIRYASIFAATSVTILAGIVIQYYTLQPYTRLFAETAYKQITKDFPAQIKHGWPQKEVNQCIKHNFSESNINYPDSYKVIRAYLMLKQDFNGKVFSYPADPLFYVLLNQTPPKYFNLYDASAKKAQLENIEYIERENIDYILFNTKSMAIQDSVPDYVRGKTIFKYLLKNYRIETKIDTFLVLRRINTVNEYDLLSSAFILDTTELNYHLHNPQLGGIPRAEGLYKYKSINNSLKLPFSVPINSKNIILIAQHQKPITIQNAYMPKESTFVRLVIENNQEIIIHYTPCNKSEYCIIRLDNIPAFYQNRVITQISGDSKYPADYYFTTLGKTEEKLLW